MDFRRLLSANTIPGAASLARAAQFLNLTKMPLFLPAAWGSNTLLEFFQPHPLDRQDNQPFLSFMQQAQVHSPAKRGVHSSLSSHNLEAHPMDPGPSTLGPHFTSLCSRLVLHY